MDEVHTKIALSGDNPFWMIWIECGEKNCRLLTKVYIREFAVLSEPSAISYVMEALGGRDAKCPAGHLVSNHESEKYIRKILEQKESPL